jgi:NO-binding membrane sensor protein with MHYT domain
MHGTYNLPLVLLSLVIATLASYTALDLAAFISLLEKRTPGAPGWQAARSRWARGSGRCTSSACSRCRCRFRSAMR